MTNLDINKELIERLRKRAEIRKRIRKEEDRIAKDLEEAALVIENLAAELDTIDEMYP